MHGQITSVKLIKGFNNLIIDCGGYWLKHDKTNNLYREGMYDRLGRFTSLNWITRQQFISNLKHCLKHLKRIS